MFSSESKTINESLKYIVLFISIMLCSYIGVTLLSFFETMSTSDEEENINMDLEITGLL